MIIPRIGAICLLIGFGFAVAQVSRLMYVTAREGYSSWLPVALLLAPTAILGLASAILVLRRRSLGIRLALPFCGLLVITAVITRDAVNELKLKRGDEAVAIIKSTEVMIGRTR